MNPPESGKRTDLSIRLVRNDVFGKFADGYSDRMRRQLGNALAQNTAGDSDRDRLTFAGDFLDPASGKSLLEKLGGLSETLDEAKLFFQIFLTLKTTYDEDRFATTSAYLESQTVAGLAALGLPLEFSFTPASASPSWADEGHAALLEGMTRTAEGPYAPGERDFLYSLIARGPALDPDRITQALSTPHDRAHRAGDKGRKGKIYDRGMWRRDFEKANELPLSDQELCAFMLEKENILRTLAESHEIEISLGVFHRTIQSVLVPFTVSGRTLSLIARVDGELNIDVYPPFFRKE